MNSAQNYWRRCSVCKKEIPLAGQYYLCSVSTCRQKRTGLVFCSISCWDGHLGYANHREAHAEEATAPKQVESENTPSVPVRRIITDSPTHKSNPASISNKRYQGDALVVVSKVKKLVKDNVDFNTSQCAIDELTQIVATACQQAIEEAKRVGRKTVMGRDFQRRT